MDCTAPIISEISERMKQVGDLPLFNATIYRIRQINSDPDSSAIALSNEITKDSSLTATLLRISNSSYYNRGAGKISAISRAVVILGYETIMNLCLTLKLIETFQQEHPGIDIKKILVNAYQAASFSRELALKAGIRNIEETYTCALMHNLGEIIVAYFLPEKYLRLMELSQQDDAMKAAQIEQEVLGIRLQEIGQCLAHNWDFPSTIVNTMEHYPVEEPGRPRHTVRINQALASMSTTLLGRLHDQRQNKDIAVDTLMNKMADIVGLDHNVIEGCLMDSFKMSCELAQDFGISKEILMPVVKDSGDPLLDRIAGRLAYATSNYTKSRSLETEAAPDEHPAMETMPAVEPDIDEVPQPDIDENTVPGTETPPDVDLQLQYINDITTQMAASATLNTIFAIAVEAIQRSAGFQRAALCLLHPDHSRYSARIVSGENTEPLKTCLDSAVDLDHDLLSKVIFDGDEMIVQDIRHGNWSDVIREDFIDLAQAESFIIASLRANEKPVGLIYADTTQPGSTIDPSQQRGFHQFVAQARLALKINS